MTGLCCSNCSDSTVTYTYQSAGIYNVTVFVTSNWYDEPFRADLPGQFHVVEEISGLRLHQAKGEFAVNLYRGHNQDLTTTEQLFMAR